MTTATKEQKGMQRYFCTVCSNERQEPGDGRIRCRYMHCDKCGHPTTHRVEMPPPAGYEYSGYQTQDGHGIYVREKTRGCVVQVKAVNQFGGLEYHIKSCMIDGVSVSAYVAANETLKKLTEHCAG